MLVEAQLLSPQQLDGMLQRQRRDGRRLGALLVETGLISEVQLTQLLSQQLSVPWVSLYHIDFSRKLLDLVSRSLAERFCLVPVFVRRVKDIGQVLYIAMDDPSDEEAKLAVAEYSGLPVRAMIAPPSDIRSAIRSYYGGANDGVTDSPLAAAAVEHGRETIPDFTPAKALAELEPALPTTMPSTPPAAFDDTMGHRESVDARAYGPEDGATAKPTGVARAEAADKSVAPVGVPAERTEAASETARGAVSVSPRASDLPPPRRGAPTKGVVLTLLDGTEIVLPARSPVDESGVPLVNGHLTARDLIQALLATGQGADASEVFGGPPRWEHVAAALLSILLKKRLVADWEFAEEYRRLSQGR